MKCAAVWPVQRVVFLGLAHRLRRKLRHGSYGPGANRVPVSDERFAAVAPCALLAHPIATLAREASTSVIILSYERRVLGRETGLSDRGGWFHGVAFVRAPAEAEGQSYRIHAWHFSTWDLRAEPEKFGACAGPVGARCGRQPSGARVCAGLRRPQARSNHASRSGSLCAQVIRPPR